VQKKSTPYIDFNQAFEADGQHCTGRMKQCSDYKQSKLSIGGVDIQ
jgi:hypothetical protein